MSKILKYDSGVLSYPSSTNMGGYSYDLTERQSTYPPCREIFKQFKNIELSPEASKLKRIFDERDSEELKVVPYSGLKPEQNEGVAILLRNKRSILCDEVGQGKTLQALTVASVLNGPTLYITKKTLISQVQEEVLNWYPNIQHQIDIINYEQASNYIKNKYTLLIIDEAHSVKNKAAKRSKIIAKIAHKTEYLIMLTGTPIEKSPSDIWHLMNLLDRKMWSSYWRWINYFTEYDELPNGIRVNQRPKNIEVFKSTLTDYYIRRISERTKPIFIDVEVKLYKTQLELYKLVKKEAYIPQYDLTIPNEISRLIYLRQLAIESSWLTNNESESVKIDKCVELINIHINDNIVIFSSFVRPLEVLYSKLSHKAHLFKTGEDISFNENKIILLTFQSGGTGLNLQAASICIMLDIPQSSITFTQAIGRLDRIGQTVIPTFYNILALNTVDKRVNKLMETKLDNVKKLVTRTDR